MVRCLEQAPKSKNRDDTICIDESPTLIVLLRNASLTLSVDHKPVEPDVYLDHCLEKVESMTQSKKTFFPRRKCFKFPAPAISRQDRQAIARGTFEEQDLDSGFVQSEKELIEFIYNSNYQSFQNGKEFLDKLKKYALIFATKTEEFTNPSSKMFDYTQFTIRLDSLESLRKTTPILPPQNALAVWATQFPRFPKDSSVQIAKPKTVIHPICAVCSFGYSQKPVEATRYCIDCSDNMCESCFHFHRRFRVTRPHQVIDVAIETTVLTKEMCSCRLNKSLEYHCLDHQVYCCSTCRSHTHSSCGDVRNIAAMSDYIRFYEIDDKAMANMDQIKQNFEHITTLSEENKAALGTAKQRIFDEIKKIRADLESLLVQIEEVMTEELNTLYEQATTCLTDHIQRCKTAVEEANTCMRMYKSAQRLENDQLYISHNRYLQEMTQLEKALHETASNTMTSEFSFEQNELTKLLPTKLKTFGEIRTKVKKDVFTPKLSEMKLRCRKPNKIKSLKVPDPCYLRGVAMLPNGCCVATNYDTSVLMFDYNDQLTAKLNISGVWDVCIIGENEVAVTTMGQRKIHFLSTDNDLVCTRTISTNRPCCGIAYCRMTRELVITTSYPDPVQILTLTGDVVKTIENDRDGQQMFSFSAYYVAVNDTGDMLYVSDYYRGVIGVDRDGHVKFIYTDVKYPCGISIDGDGSIYVCGLGSNDVHQLSPDGSRIQILLSSGLTMPFGLYFNKRNDTFVVTCLRSQNLLVYEMQ